MILLAAAIALLLAAIAWRVAAREQQRTGLPVRRVHFDDARASRPERALVSHRHRLTGRPDYILEESGAMIPVEVKPTRRASRPYESDLMQLAAYCLLVEDSYGTPPPYGILRYASASWQIPWGDEPRVRLLEVLDEMNRAERQPDVQRSHERPALCAACSQRPACDQAL